MNSFINYLISIFNFLVYGKWEYAILPIIIIFIIINAGISCYSFLSKNKIIKNQLPEWSALAQGILIMVIILYFLKIIEGCWRIIAFALILILFFLRQQDKVFLELMCPPYSYYKISKKVYKYLVQVMKLFDKRYLFTKTFVYDENLQVKLMLYYNINKNKSKTKKKK